MGKLGKILEGSIWKWRRTREGGVATRGKTSRERSSWGWGAAGAVNS